MNSRPMTEASWRVRLRGFCQAVDAGHNDVLDGVRNDHLLGGPGQHRRAPRLANSPHVLQRFDNLLHKEGIAFRALGDQGLEGGRQAVRGQQCLRHLDAVWAGEGGQGKAGVVGPFPKGMRHSPVR